MKFCAPLLLIVSILLSGCLPAYEVRVVNSTRQNVSIRLMSAPWPHSPQDEPPSHELLAADVGRDGVMHAYAHGDFVLVPRAVRVRAKGGDREVEVPMPRSLVLVGRIVENGQTGEIEFQSDPEVARRAPGDGRRDAVHP